MPDSVVDYGQVWKNVHEHLDGLGLPSQQRAFLQLAALRGMLESTAIIAVPNDFTKDVLERTLREQIADALTSVLGLSETPVNIAVTVDASMSTGEEHFEPSFDGPSAGDGVVVDQGEAVPAAEPAQTAATERFAGTSGPQLFVVNEGDLLPRDRTLSESGPQQDGDVIDFVPGPRPQHGELEPMEATHLNPVCLRAVRHRLLEPVRPRRRGCGRRAPARHTTPVHLWRVGAGQDPAPRDRPLRPAAVLPVRVRYVNSEFTNDFINSIP